MSTAEHVGLQQQQLSLSLHSHLLALCTTRTWQVPQGRCLLYLVVLVERQAERGDLRERTSAVSVRCVQMLAPQLACTPWGLQSAAAGA